MNDRALRTGLVLSALWIAAAIFARPAAAGSWARAGEQYQVKGCSVTVYTDPTFQGASWSTKNSWSVVGWEFRDRISSIKIRSGIWQFFKGDQFNSQIETLFPGNYAHLKPNETNVIRSFRCERAT